jgi:hypothetical protein
MSDEHALQGASPPSLWVAMPLAALAGGMGWGIRGQYGHETGAMIAGVLLGPLLVLLFCPRAPALYGARVAALFALGLSLGGSMTYGQTVGLTHDPELVGHLPALGWGLFGLFLKGGIWIAWSAAFLGIGLGGHRYRAVELGLLLIAFCLLWFLGVHLLNEPFDPANRILPRVYFSDDWRWEPTAELSPRREVWGGLLVPLIALVLYARIAKGDRLVLRLSCWGFLAGGLGFSLGQCIQAGHAWNRDWFRSTAFFKELEPHMNWWNTMEITFGALFGALLALALWLNCHLIDRSATARIDALDSDELGANDEWTLAVIHTGAVLAWNFLSYSAFDRFADLALTMVLIPTIAVVAGQRWPYLVSLPIVLVPIAGKTVRELAYYSQDATVWVAWTAYLAAPTVVAMLAAWWLFQRQPRQSAARSAALMLLVNTWVYFALNLAFFRYPWPWQAWTGRTPSAVFFFVCALGLTAAALFYGRAELPSSTGAESSVGAGSSV